MLTTFAPRPWRPPASQARRSPPAAGRDGWRGQGVGEFALVLVPFLLLLFAVFDVGRGIYTYNGVAQAAREIARATIVHPYAECCELGSSAEAEASIAAQKTLVPGLEDAGIAIACVDIADQPVTGSCRSGQFVKVTVTVAWQPVTPLLAALGLHELTSVTRMQLQ